MKAAALAEGHVRRAPSGPVEGEADPLAGEALAAFRAGMTLGEIAFCLDTSPDRARYLVERARTAGL